MAGKISRLAQEHVERRDHVRVPTAWIGAEAAPGMRRGGTPWLCHVDEAGEIAAARGPVLVMLGGEGAGPTSALLAHAEAGERVYVLSASGWDPRAAHARLRSSPRVLLRRVPQLAVSGILTSLGAWLWVGDRGGADARWRLRLDDEQAEALRQSFLRLFWHAAIDEAWTGAQPPVFRPARERRFEVPEPSSRAPIRIVHADAVLDLDAPAELVHLAGGEPPSGSPRRLWLPPSGSHHDRLASLVRGGAEVRWIDRGLPDVAIGAQRGVMLLPGAGGQRWRIALNREQAGATAALLEQPGAWRFEINVRLGDHAAGVTRVQPSGAVAAEPVQPEQVIDAGSVQAALLSSVAGERPASWPPPAALSLSIRYRWTVLPPRLPARTEEDGIVKKWRQLDDRWAKRRAQAQAELTGMARERERLGQRYKQLTSALLGFARTESHLCAALATLAARTPSAAGPSSAGEVLGELARIEEEARGLQRALEVAEREAQVAEAREAQEAAWRRSVEEARQTLLDRRTALSGAQAQWTELEAALEGIAAALGSADPDAKKDLEARRAKLSDERKRLDKRIPGLEHEVAELARREAKPFDFKPPSAPAKLPPATAAPYVPAASALPHALAVPEEALPAVGQLRGLHGQRYLVVETWEELAAGEAAAARLKAQLVAPEDA